MARHALLSSGTKAAWGSLCCARSELRLDLTLGCGQTFRWRETSDGHWTGVMGGRVWTLTQTEDTLWYHTYQNPKGDEGLEEGAGRKRKATGSLLREPVNEKKSEKKLRRVKVEEEDGGEAAAHVPVQEEELGAMLRDYFQLDVKLGDLYREWGAADPHFRRIANIFSGVRMLRQEPTECLFSFICTSNNHISRIQGMVERLCQALGGAPLATLDQTRYYNFPSLDSLAAGSVEACLRDLGFGYRARFLQQSAQKILDQHGGAQWLQNLREVPYLQARDALRTLPGVGIKVADCVCLMSLDKADAVPVDTHVWQIARRDYGCAAGSGHKSLTDRVHRDIGDFFRQLWGPYAGWAHSVLFCADLKKFQKMKETVVSVKQEEEEEDAGEAVKKKNVKKEGNRSVKLEEEAETQKKKKVKKEEKGTARRSGGSLTKPHTKIIKSEDA